LIETSTAFLPDNLFFTAFMQINEELPVDRSIFPGFNIFLKQLQAFFTGSLFILTVYVFFPTVPEGFLEKLFS
jgi:hypothetical protein